MIARAAATVLAVLTATTLSVSGCSSSASHRSGSTAAGGSARTGASSATAAGPDPGSAAASSAPARGDASALLLPAAELGVPGATLSGTQAVPGASGVVGLYTAAGGRRLGDSIILLPTRQAAATALEGAGSAVSRDVTASVTADVPIGDGGRYYAGKSPDGSSAVAVVTFTKGKAFVTMEFTSSASDPVPEALARSIAGKQAARLV